MGIFRRQHSLKCTREDVIFLFQDLGYDDKRQWLLMIQQTEGIIHWDAVAGK